MSNKLDKSEAIALMDRYGSEKRPFLFIIDYEMKKNLVYPLDEVPHFIHYDFNGVSNRKTSLNKKEVGFKKRPLPFEVFDEAFANAIKELKYGNSFLLNLTFPTELYGFKKLSDLYPNVEAKYKLLIDDHCVVFSPETFIKIKDGKVHSFPMKGTIDAEVPDALETILADEKEMAEHYTIVDLIRNDLSMIAKEVRVDRFRYADLVRTNEKQLYQISSEIVGTLEETYSDKLGALIFKLLPAGSISGAPKAKTVEIIKDLEKQDRGYYTGVMGIFDGENVDSGVMIRYIEKTDEGFRYRSGSGITHQSKSRSEYEELLDKVYLPIKQKDVS